MGCQRERTEKTQKKGLSKFKYIIFIFLNLCDKMKMKKIYFWLNLERVGRVYVQGEVWVWNGGMGKRMKRGNVGTI